MFRLDERSTAGKPLPVREHLRLLVIGAGAAGLAAALEAARRGVQVVLVDEHPVDHALMGLDVPFHFGQRMSGATRNKARMIEAIAAADSQIAEAFEAGVDVRLGVSVWGLFSPQPGLRWLSRRVAGLSDGDDCWFVSFDAVIVAAGRRDIGLAFPGWELPGVMGVTAAQALLERYDALESRRIVILGSGAEATSFARAALAAGRQIAAMVEVADAPRDAAGCGEIVAQGVPVLTETMVARATGGIDGVEQVLLRSLDSDAEPRTLACDTLVLAIGTAPVIELLDAAGAETCFAAARGGHVPLTDAEGRTSVPGFFAAGDCAGITAGKTADAGIAAEEGRRAATAACAELDRDGPRPAWLAQAITSAATAEDVEAARLAWVAAAMAVADAETHICQCEEVSLSDLMGVRPPRYLPRDQAPMLGRDLASLADDGLISQDQIKRLTRAGMGPCQGRRCREQVGAVLARATRTPLAQLPLPSYRAPVRPLPLSAFAEDQEPLAVTQNWEGWFGIPGQWDPFWTLPDDADGQERP
jgi:thioredoxin reductase